MGEPTNLLQSTVFPDGTAIIATADGTKKSPRFRED